jgi:hypothetical protein
MPGAVATGSGDLRKVSSMRGRCASSGRRCTALPVRIQSAAGGGEQFRAPGDLDYVDLLERHLGTGWEFETKVVFDACYEDAARHVRPQMGRLERTGDGQRCYLIGTTSNPAMYAGEWLAAIPIRFHVEGGPELRAAVAALPVRLTAALGAAPGNERSQRVRSPVG